MATRQTKIVSYELQGNSTDLMHELQNALFTLDELDHKLTQISSSARMLGGKDKTSHTRATAISTAETQIEKLRARLSPERIETVSPDQLNLLKFTNVELENMIAKLDSAKSVSTVTNKELEKVKVKLKGLNNALRNANIELPQTTQHFKDFIQAIRRASVVITALKFLISYLNKLYESSAEYVETMNLFNVASRESREELYELATAMEDAYNTDIKPILNSIAVFRQYANTMGFAAEQADILGEYLTKVSLDLASLYNVSNEDMAAAVKSGLAGQTKSLMRYGISVHKATLEQYALNLGLERSWETFSETEKVALRYIAILDQASLAHGDLAKTLESPSNQIKIAKAQLQMFTRNLGSLVTIMSQFVLPVFNGFMIVLNSFLSVMAKAAGYEIPDYSSNLSENNQMLDEGTESAEEYEEAMKGLLAPMDEINQASSKSANDNLGAIDPTILDALKGYDNLMDRIYTKTDAIANALDGLFGGEFAEGTGSVLGKAFEILGQSINIVTNALTTMSPILAVVLDLVGLLLQGVSWLLDKTVIPVLSFVATLTDNIWLLVAAFAALNLAQLAATGNFKDMYAVKMAQWFAKLATKIWASTSAALANAAATLRMKIAAIAAAAAIWWETAALWQKAVAAIAAAGALAVVVGATVISATSSAKSHADSTMNTNNVPQMAKGGVVDSPTLAMIGEGRYKEAVVPLGNSPQFKTMKDDIANAVLRKINPTPNSSLSQRSGRSPVPIVLNLNGKTVARALLPDLNYVQYQVGV